MDAERRKIAEEELDRFRESFEILAGVRDMTHPIAKIAPAMWEYAVKVFGEHGKAARWMETPLAELGERTPTQVLTEDPHSEAVEAIIGRIEGGVIG